MKIVLTTEAKVMPTRQLTTLELYNITKSVVGKTVEVDLPETATIQQLQDAADVKMSVDPSLTIQEKIFIADRQLEKDMTLAGAGLEDGDTVRYAFVLLA